MKISRKHQGAAHVYFGNIAEALNDAGLTREQMIKLILNIRWTDKSVKEIIFRPTSELLGYDRSITQVTDKELCLIEKTMDEGLLNVGLDIRYPSIEEIMIRDLHKEIDNLNQ